MQLALRTKAYSQGNSAQEAMAAMCETDGMRQVIGSFLAQAIHLRLAQGTASVKAQGRIKSICP